MDDLTKRVAREIEAAEGAYVSRGPLWASVAADKAVKIVREADAARIRDLEVERDGWKDAYDRSQRQRAGDVTRIRELEALEEALRGLLDRYVDLVNCGDCGFWNPEGEDQVIAARAALSDSPREEAKT